MQILAERGYIIPAINTDDIDYVDCAQQLERSLRHWHPDVNVTIVTKDQLPYGDLGGYANDWQIFHLSPYRQTIKLEADMIAASPVDHWWTMFEHRDVVVSQGCRTFYNQPAGSRFYRKIFDDNGLPDVYNAITYWRLSKTAQDFFNLVKNIFTDWASYKTLLKFPEETPSTDVVYAMAAQIMGPKTVTLPMGYGPNITHMKRHVQPIHSNNWTHELVWEWTDQGLRINTVAQQGFFHYNIKDWRVL